MSDPYRTIADVPQSHRDQWKVHSHHHAGTSSGYERCRWCGLHAISRGSRCAGRKRFRFFGKLMCPQDRPHHHVVCGRIGRTGCNRDWLEATCDEVIETAEVDTLIVTDFGAAATGSRSITELRDEIDALRKSI